MATFLLIHGAWHWGGCWEPVRRLLERDGHEVHAPTLPHNADTRLSTHIRFVADLVRERDLRDIVLVGHSYGGMVITGLGALMPDRIRRYVFVAAFLPMARGESLLDSVLPRFGARVVKALSPRMWPAFISARGFGVTDPETAAWLDAHLRPQPSRTFSDLGSTMRAARLAEILFALEEQIEPEVADRVHGEIERRLFRKVADDNNNEFWHTARMNWNHVCNGSIIRAALLEIRDPRALAQMLHPVIQHMSYALDGFTDDGGCVEGPGYWAFGFGHFVQAAYALHSRTGGELNIMADEKVERNQRRRYRCLRQRQGTVGSRTS